MSDEEATSLEALHGVQQLLQQVALPQGTMPNTGKVDLQALEVHHHHVLLDVPSPAPARALQAAMHACCPVSRLFPVSHVHPRKRAFFVQSGARASMEAHLAALPAGMPLCSLSAAPAQPGTWLLTRCAMDRSPVSVELHTPCTDAPDCQVSTFSKTFLPVLLHFASYPVSDFVLGQLPLLPSSGEQ